MKKTLHINMPYYIFNFLGVQSSNPDEVAVSAVALLSLEYEGLDYLKIQKSQLFNLGNNNPDFGKILKVHNGLSGMQGQ